MTTILGNKRICVSCTAKFYDLGRNPAPCPKCKTMNDINAQVRTRRKKATIEVDNDDPLVKQQAKQAAKNKPKKGKNVEGIDLEEFEDIAPMDGEEEIEEIDEIEDIEDLEELEDAEVEEENEEDLTLEEDDMGDEAILDDLDEDSEAEEEEEEEAPKKKPAKGKKK